jgi:hypothetical protein
MSASCVRATRERFKVPFKYSQSRLFLDASPQLGAGGGSDGASPPQPVSSAVQDERVNERISSFPAVVMLACVAWAGLAQAQRRDEPARAIRVRGGSSCVSATALRNRITRYLAADAPPAELSIEVDLAADPPGFRVLRAGRSIAERRFERLPAGCAERRDAIALTIAVAIEHALPANVASHPEPTAAARAPAEPPATPAPASQPTAAETARANRAESQPTAAGVSRTGETAAAPQPTAARSVSIGAPQPTAARPPPVAQRSRVPEPVPESAAEPEAEPIPDTPEPERPWQRPSERWMLHAGAAYLLEVLPARIPAFSIGAEYAVLPALRLRFAGLVSTRVTIDFPPGRVYGQLFGGSAHACLNTPFFALILHGCAGAAAALAYAEGDRYTEPSSAGMAWLAGVLGILVEVPATGSVAARLVATGHVNLVRPQLYLEGPGADDVRSAGPIGASIGAEILVRVD